MSMETPGGCSCSDRIDVFLLCFFLSLRFIFHGYSSSLPRVNTNLLLRVFVTCSSPEKHTIFTPYMVLIHLLFIIHLREVIFKVPAFYSFMAHCSHLFDARSDSTCVNPIRYHVAVASGLTLRSSSSQDPRSETRKPQIRWSSREFAV